MKNNYSINTGDIFEKLEYEWENYDRKFLLSIEKPLAQILIKKKIITDRYRDELEIYHEERYPRDLKIAELEGNFPFPYYFLNYYKTEKGFDIIDYSEPCEVDPKDKYYDLFFALKLSLVDIMEAEEFLQYHLENTFEKDYHTFKLFLDNICLKYKEFLGEKYTPLILRFLARHENIIEPIKKGNKEFTTARQVLAITYLLEELKVNRNSTSLTEIAKFIHFLTGKESGSSKINDTTIYKRVKSPLTKTDKTAEKDLQFIRTYFEKLGLQSIVNKLNKEIGSKE